MHRTIREWEQIIFDRPAPLGSSALERMKRAIQRLGLQIPFYEKVFTVTGTNGKGSACRTLELMGLAMQKRVGLVTSPHLVSVLERIRFMGKSIDAVSFSQVMSDTEEVANALQLSFFEWLTLGSLYYFRQVSVDWLILEVGIGGRYDAVNAIDNDMALVTGVDWDHVTLLGPTLDHIAYEKAGIFRKNRPAIIACAEPQKSMVEAVERLGVFDYWLNRDWFCTLKEDDSFMLRLPSGSKQSFRWPKLPVMGVATALMALHVELNLPLAELSRLFDAIFSPLALPGRLQILQKEDCFWVLDVAHNPQAFAWLYKELQRLKKKAKLEGWVIICAMLREKLIISSLKQLIYYPDLFWIFPDLSSNKRAESAEVLMALFDDDQCCRASSVEKALHLAKMAAKKRNFGIVVSGSFVTVGNVLNCWNMTGDAIAYQ